MKSKLFITLLLVSSLFFSCRKPINEFEVDQTNKFSAEVANNWLGIQLRILRIAGPSPYGMNGNRYFAYTGIALYESVLPGMAGYQSLSGQLTNMPTMPSIEPDKSYHWPSSANAALAFLNKNFYSAASQENKAAMDSLENALNTTYQTQTDAETFQRSVSFGKLVAQRIFDWSKTDESLNTYPAPVFPTVAGGWTPTAPNPTAVFAAYWGKNRLFVKGSTSGTSSPPPPAYSTDPNSAYYAMVKEVYDISLALTPEQKATALYFRDNPGFQAGTHYISIFNHVMQTEKLTLDLYAVAQAKTGISLAESQIACWKDKYEMLVDRPIRYIREVMGHTTWSPLLTTPPHPEFPSGHSQTGGALGAVLTSLFGDNYRLTINTYGNLNMPPRSYKSFTEMVDDIGDSRVYGGIHFNYTCKESSKQGSKIAKNILNILKFKK